MNQLPSQVGKYKVESLVGEGGMGAVYKAAHPTLNRHVIIKKLTLTEHSSFVERFKREASILLDLHHEHIVQVYDHFKEGNSYYIVMEFVDGVALDTLIKKRKTIPSEAAILIFSEICSALQYAHDHQVIHRDIKPANILISKEGKVKLLDFGVATSMNESGEEELTKAGMSIGTPSYMPPEQFNDAKNVDNRADIYSLGVLFYEMVTGKKPFQGGFTNEVFVRIEKGKYIPPRKINPSVLPLIQRIIKKAMHHKKKRRYQDAGDITAKLKKHLKRYPDKETVHKALQLYLEEKDFSHLQKRASFIKRFFYKILIGSALTAILLGVLSLFGYPYYQRGWHYEYLKPDEYGALQFILQIRRNQKKLEDKYVRLSLYREEKGKYYRVKDKPFNFKETVEKKNRLYHLLSSPILYLRESNYKVFIAVENEQYEANFYLNPRNIQKLALHSRDARKISFSAVRNQAPIPLKLSYKVRDIQSDHLITDTTRIFIKRGKNWIDWEEFHKSNEYTTTFTTGKKHTLLFKHEGYYSREMPLRPRPEQNVFTLDVRLIPIPGTLFLKSDSTELEALVNNSRYYINGTKERKNRLIEPLSTQYQELILTPGDYFITARSKESFFNPLSRTQKITIESKAKVFLEFQYDQKKQALKFKLK